MKIFHDQVRGHRVRRTGFLMDKNHRDPVYQRWEKELSKISDPSFQNFIDWNMDVLMDVLMNLLEEELNRSQECSTTDTDQQI